MRRSVISACAVAIAVSWTSAGEVRAAQKDNFVKAIQASTELPEESLLDIGILILDPGLNEEDASRFENKGVFEDVRKSESQRLEMEGE